MAADSGNSEKFSPRRPGGRRDPAPTEKMWENRGTSTGGREGAVGLGRVYPKTGAKGSTAAAVVTVLGGEGNKERRGRRAGAAAGRGQDIQGRRG